MLNMIKKLHDSLADQVPCWKKHLESGCRIPVLVAIVQHTECKYANKEIEGDRYVRCTYNVNIILKYIKGIPNRYVYIKGCI